MPGGLAEGFRTPVFIKEKKAHTWMMCLLFVFADTHSEETSQAVAGDPR